MTYTIRQIAAVLGVTERAVQKRAKNEGWPASTFQSGRRKPQSFKLSALPRDIKDVISKAKGPRAAPGEFATIMEIAVAMGVTRQAVSKRALDEGWVHDPEARPKRYAVASLPEDIRAVLTDPGSLDSGYAELKRTARKDRHVGRKRRSSLGDEEFRLLLGKIKQVLGVRSDAEVARSLGYTQSSMTGAKRKKQIPSSWLIQIAREKGVSLDWLVFGVASEKPANSTEAPSQGPSVHVHVCRFVSDQDGVRFDVNSAIPPMTFPEDYFGKHRDIMNLIAVESSGDSMYPEVLPGDVVVVDTKDALLTPGGMFAVDICGMLYLKRVDMAPGRLILSCANPAYSDIEVPIVGGKPDGISIVGKVVWLGRRISN